MAGSNGIVTEQVRADGHSVGELFQELAHETSNLFSLEVALAKAELSQKASQAGKDVGFLAIGGAVAYAGFLVLLLAVVIGLANLIPAWLSALIVGAVVAIIGYALVRKGLNDLRRWSPAPEQTIESLQADKRMVQEQMR